MTFLCESDQSLDSNSPAIRPPEWCPKDLPVVDALKFNVLIWTSKTTMLNCSRFWSLARALLINCGIKAVRNDICGLRSLSSDLCIVQPSECTSFLSNVHSFYEELSIDLVPLSLHLIISSELSWIEHDNVLTSSSFVFRLRLNDLQCVHWMTDHSVVSRSRFTQELRSVKFLERYIDYTLDYKYSWLST